MAEIKYFSHDNAKVFAKEIKALIEAAKEAAAYDDTALAGRVTTVEGQLTTLTGADTVSGSVAEAKKAGTDAAAAVVTEKGRAEGAEKDLADRLDVLEGEGEGSVKAAATAAVAQIVGGASADFDTLKEIETWIGAHETAQTAADLVNKVGALENAVGAKNTAAEGSASNASGLYKDIEDVKKLIADANKDIDDLGALASKDKVAEADIEGTLPISKIAGLQDALDAKQATIADETYDAFGAAATAETNAKAYADSLKDTHTEMTEAEVKALFTTTD